MDSIPDPTTVTSWPSALVTVVLILAVLVVPSVLTYMGNRQTKKAVAAAQDSRDAAQAGQQAAQAVETTLTTTNGGSHVKDQLNRIEKSNRAVREDQALMAQSIGQVQADVSELRDEVAQVKAAAARHHPEDQPPT